MENSESESKLHNLGKGAKVRGGMILIGSLESTQLFNTQIKEGSDTEQSVSLSIVML